MASQKTAAKGKARASPKALRTPGTKSGIPQDLESAAAALGDFPVLYERWRNKRITDDDYFSRRGCFHDCEIDHDHFPPGDGVPVLLVEYIGDWPIITHDRHDASRAQPVIVFSSNGGPVKVTDPFDKFRYIRNAWANPSAWHVRWEGSAEDGWLPAKYVRPEPIPQVVEKSSTVQRRAAKPEAAVAGGEA